MRLANFQKGSAAQSSQPDCFAATGFSAMITFVSGPKALDIHSAAVQGGRQGVESKWACQGAPNQEGAEMHGLNELLGI